MSCDHSEDWHGDSSIYNALVILAQKWKTNVLLIDGHGNFGSLEDSAASSRYCHTGDTYVNIKDVGLITIDEYIDKYIGRDNHKDGYYYVDNMFTKGLNGQFVPSDCIIDSGVHDIYHLKLRNGYELRGTPNHPVLTLQWNKEERRPELKWKRLDEIRENDDVVLDGKCDPENTVEILTDRETKEAAFLGCMISEGYLTTQYGVGIINTDKHLINIVKDFLLLNYPDANIEIGMHPTHSSKHPCYQIMLRGKRYATFYNKMLKHYEFGRYSNERAIPSWVFTKPRKYKSILLSYLFEGDGCVKTDKDTRLVNSCMTTLIQYDTNSIKLAKQVQLLLAEFGINTTIHRDKRERRQGYGYKIIITGKQNVRRFAESIGFISDRKRGILSRYVEQPDKLASGSVYTAKCIQAVGCIYANGHVINPASEQTFNYWYNEYKTSGYADTDIIKWYKEFYKNHKTTYVVSCTKTDTQERVYSLRINTKDHAYITNGIVSHNTECRLTKYAEEVMLGDLSKDVVDYVENYDNTTVEPVILPCKLPNLLINGGEGTGMGFSCTFLPHNPREVIDLLIAYIDNRKMDWKEAMRYLKGPDFPTGGIINGINNSLSMYYSGIGNVKCRAKIDTEELKNGYINLVITELPYNINKLNLLSKINSLYETGELNIRYCHDESSKEGLRIVIQLKKDEDPERVKNLLYKKTSLESSYSVAQYAVDYDHNGNLIPKLCNLMTIIQKFVTFREQCIHRKLIAEMNKKNDRLHILKGLFIVNKEIDKAIQIIRNSNGGNDTVTKLMSFFKLTEVQARYIVDMKLGRLSKLDMNLSREEEKKLKEEVKVLMRQTRSTSNTDIDQYMVEEWTNIKNTIFKNCRRKTQIIKEQEKIEIDSTIRDIPCSIIITKKGYIKRTPLMSNVQNRAGLGITLGLGVDDEIMQIIHTSTTTPIYAVTSTGRAFLFKPYTLDETSKNSRGKYIRTLFHLKDNETIIRFINHEPNKNGLFIATKKGLVKLTDLEELSSINASGKRIFGLDKSDAVADIALVNTDSEILIVTADGMGLRTKLSNIRVTGTTAMGVNGIAVKENDYVTGIAEIENKSDIVFISENAFIKRCEENEFNTQNRGGYGVIVSPKTEEYGSLVAVATANKTVTICTRDGKLLTLNLNTVRKVSRKSKGVKAVTLLGTDKVIGIC